MNKIISSLILLTFFASKSYAADISFFLDCSPDCTKTVVKSIAPKKADPSNNSNNSSGDADLMKSISSSSGPSTLDMKGGTSSGNVIIVGPKKEVKKQPSKYKGENGTDNTDVSGGWDDNINNEDGKWKAEDHKDEDDNQKSSEVGGNSNENVDNLNPSDKDNSDSQEKTKK